MIITILIIYFISVIITFLLDFAYTQTYIPHLAEVFIVKDFKSSIFLSFFSIITLLSLFTHDFNKQNMYDIINYYKNGGFKQSLKWLFKRMQNDY